MRIFAAAPSATIMWGMGVTQFGGVDVVRGWQGAAHRQLGRPNVGVGPVRGKQRTGRLRYGRAAEPVSRLSGGHRPRRAGEIRRRTGHRPGADGRPVGTRITEVPHALTGGSKPIISWAKIRCRPKPTSALVRKGIEALDFVVVQDIFDQNSGNGRCPAAGHLTGEHGGVFTCADRGFQRFEQAILRRGM